MKSLFNCIKPSKITEIRRLNEQKFMNVTKKFIPTIISDNSPDKSNIKHIHYIRQLKELYWIFQEVNLTKDDIFDIATDVSEITGYRNIGIIMYDIANNALDTNFCFIR